MQSDRNFNEYKGWSECVSCGTSKHEFNLQGYKCSDCCKAKGRQCSRIVLPNLDEENVYSYLCLSCGVRFDGIGKPILCSDCVHFFKALNRIPPPKFDLRKVHGFSKGGHWISTDETPIAVSGLLGLRRSASKNEDKDEPVSQKPRSNPVKEEKPSACPTCKQESVGRCPVCDK